MQTLPVRRVLLIVCLLLAALSLALAFLYEPPSSNTVPASGLQDSAVPYTVKSHQGYVAVFTRDAEVPSRVTGIRVDLLPLQDQLELAEGIPVRTEEALSALLEDYGA